MLKNRVAAGFSQASAQYDQYAVLQQMSAAAMAEKISTILPSLPSGPVLEIGCGTGGVTKILVEKLTGREILVTDLSVDMVQICRRNLLANHSFSDSVRWAVADGELISEYANLAFIVSALTIQWFQNLENSFSRLLKTLVPGGVLLCSYVSGGSFPEWRQICLETDVPFTANPLPAADFHNVLTELSHFEVHSWSSDLKVCFDSAKDFFQSLKKTGSGTSLVDKRLMPSQLRKLIRAWDTKVGKGQVKVTYAVSYLVVCRSSGSLEP